MELTDFIRSGLERVKAATSRVVDGLSHHELMWRPGPGANSIGIILFHTARSEDSFVQARIQGKPEVWESQKWYEKMNLPASEAGRGYTTPEQCAAFQVPELKDLLAYAEAVRGQTLAYLNTMTPDKYDKKVSHPRLGEMSIGAFIALMLVHMSQHAGEISYIRGLQRGMDK